MHKTIVAIILTSLIFFSSCKNKNVNEGSRFRPRLIKDSFKESEFSKVTIEGVDYLMMERDNNNPHEGFGFMAFRANKLIEKQDSIVSYLKTLEHFQKKMYGKMLNKSPEQVNDEYSQVYRKYLKKEKGDL